jgi:tRNA(Ile)-lysidine synthase
VELASRCHFNSQQGHLNLGVSGGADSVAMLILAADSGFSLTVIHVDHGLRPSSGEEAELVRSLAVRFGAEFQLCEVDVAPGPNLEERARLARYGAFPDEISVAHTVEDQAETVLLALLRGAGLDGLSGMSECGPGPDPSRQQWVHRPLLRVRRAETEQLCAARGIDVVHDPSNRDKSFRRNRVRYELLPLMSEIADRDVAALIGRQSSMLASEKAYLDELAAKLDPCDVRSLRSQPLALQRRSIYRWLRTAAPADAASVDRVLAVVRGETKATQVVGGRIVRRSKGRLIMEAPPGGDLGLRGDDV